jgi:uncharacterized Zn finger protein
VFSKTESERKTIMSNPEGEEEAERRVRRRLLEEEEEEEEEEEDEEDDDDLSAADVLCEVLTSDLIESKASKKSIWRGEAYARDGHVSNIVKRGSVWSAVVTGESAYTTTIELVRNDVMGACSCPFDFGGWCKHVVALAVLLNGSVRTRADERIHFDRLVAGREAAELRDLLWSLVQSDACSLSRIESFFR